MKLNNLKKLSIFFVVFVLFTLFFCSSSVYASDYKYKVLDKKYNPSADKLINGTLETPDKIVAKTEKKKGFDFLRFLALTALLMIPIGVVKFSCKTFVHVSDELKEKGCDYVPDEDLESEENICEASKEKVASENIENLEVEKTANKVVANATSPIKSKKTVMLNKSKLTKNKGLCVVEHNGIYALVGYINEKVFLLQKFNELKNTEIRPRWTEKVNEKDRYIVRLGNSYKALVEVCEDEINLLIEL